MPFGDTAKKLKQVSQMGEKLYARLNELFEQVQDLRNRVENTSEQISTMDRELAEQRAIVEALAEQQGIDVDEVVAEATSEAGGEEETAASDAGEGEPAESGTVEGETAESEAAESETAASGPAAPESPEDDAETTEVPVTESKASGGSDGAGSESRE